MDNMTQFRFDPETFVSKGHGTDSGEWDESTKADITKLRQYYPELEHWGDLAIGSAFSSFSGDVLEVNWGTWMLDKRDEDFLSYCCWMQQKGKWTFGMNYQSADPVVLNLWKKG